MSTVNETTRSRLGLRIEQARWDLVLPDGARRLIASGDFDGRDNDTLVRWLASEGELSKRLLKWCNTPLYNQCKPYQSLEEASKVIPGRDLAQLAVLVWVRGAFLPDRHLDLYSRERLWMHSMSVASVSSLIARTCNLADPQLAFIAGAFHDIGMLASERLDPDAFSEVVSEIDSLSPTHEVEKDQLGWDHTELGAAILEQWGMPDAIVQAAAQHHHAHLAVAKWKKNPGQFNQEHVEIVCCVTIANYLCARAGLGSIGTVPLPTPRENVFQTLGMEAALITVLWQQLPAAFEAVRELN